MFDSVFRSGGLTGDGQTISSKRCPGLSETFNEIIPIFYILSIIVNQII